MKILLKLFSDYEPVVYALGAVDWKQDLKRTEFIPHFRTTTERSFDEAGFGIDTTSGMDVDQEAEEERKWSW